MNLKTIAISQGNYEALRNFGKTGMSFNDVISELIKRAHNTENSCSSDYFEKIRSEKIATSRGFDPSEVLKNTSVCKVYNSSHLELIIKDLGKYINKFKAKLVVIDSIISLHRAEFSGRGTLADR